MRSQKKTLPQFSGICRFISRAKIAYFDFFFPPLLPFPSAHTDVFDTHTKKKQGKSKRWAGGKTEGEMVGVKGAVGICAKGGGKGGGNLPVGATGAHKRRFHIYFSLDPKCLWDKQEREGGGATAYYDDDDNK